MKKILSLLCMLLLMTSMANAISLNNGLGGAEGYGENQLTDNDDGSTGAIDLSTVFSSGLNFYGTTYNSLYVNNNGNITFNSQMGTYIPYNLTGATLNPILAPFFADVDTRGTGDVYYDLDTSNGIFTTTWDAVGYYNQHTDPTNSFQLILTDRGNGDFDIEFRYDYIGWTLGDYSGTDHARAGWNSGNGVDYYELPQSGIEADMLNLTNTTNVGTDGLWQWQVRNGSIIAPPAPVPEPATMVLMGLGIIGLAGVSRKKMMKK